LQAASKTSQANTKDLERQTNLNNVR